MSGQNDESLAGRPFIVCMATPFIFRSAILQSLLANLRGSVRLVDRIWPTNAGWVAPESYRREMGGDLVNVVLSFPGLMTIEQLVNMKAATMALEGQFSRKECRMLNLNPGLALRSGVLVASRKPKGDIRESLGSGVWGQWVLVEKHGKLEPSSNTFGEYSAPGRMRLFERLARTPVRDSA